MNELRIVVVIFVIIGAGFVGLSFLFSDLGPGETIQSRVATGAGWYFVAGAIVGALAGRRWPLAGLVTWFVMILGIMGLASRQYSWFLIASVLPLALSILGGYVGFLVSRAYSRWRAPRGSLQGK